MVSSQLYLGKDEQLEEGSNYKFVAHLLPSSLACFIWGRRAENAPGAQSSRHPTDLEHSSL